MIKKDKNWQATCDRVTCSNRLTIREDTETRSDAKQKIREEGWMITSRTLCPKCQGWNNGEW